jgi:uncharacterized protein (UPF0332 family)
VKAADFLDKAARAAASARLLLNAGDVDGACNRAYYAMFDAARAALLVYAGDASETRTHSGLIAAFGLRLVKSGLVRMELGKALNRVFEIRQAADYTEQAVSRESAGWAVDQADEFVAAMIQLVDSGGQ